MMYRIYGADDFLYHERFLHDGNGFTVPNVGDILVYNPDILQLDELGAAAKLTATSDNDLRNNLFPFRPWTSAAIK